MEPTTKSLRLHEVVLRGAIWAFVGIIFGFVFVVLAEFLREPLSMSLRIPVAIIGAAVLTAVFYGSMRLTVVVANLTFIAMVAYTWGSAQPALEPLVFIGGGIGLVAGAIYGLKDKQSRVFCADAKIVAGLYAGVLAAGIAYLLTLLMRESAYPWAAIIAAPVAILIYVTSAHWFIKRCHHLIPPVGDGAIVGFGVGAATGLAFLIMAATLDPDLLQAGRHRSIVEGVQRFWLPTVLGSAAICFTIGVLRGLFRVRWYAF